MPAAAASARKVSQNYAIYAIYVARGATLLGRHKDTRVNQSTQTEREREAATHLAPVALRVAWQYLPPLLLSFFPSAAAHLIFGNINLLTTYTTCCAAMRRFCCFCHVFSPSLSLFARNRTAPAAAVAAVYVASIAPKIGSAAAAAAAANKMY